jgi:hypothetical protein
MDKHPTLKSLFAYAEEQKGSIKKAEKSDTDKTAPKK